MERLVVLRAMGGSEVVLLIRSFVMSRLSNLAQPTSQMMVFMKLEERDRVASQRENMSALPGISSFVSSLLVQFDTIFWKVMSTGKCRYFRALSKDGTSVVLRVKKQYIPLTYTSSSTLLQARLAIRGLTCPLIAFSKIDGTLGSTNFSTCLIIKLSNPLPYILISAFKWLISTLLICTSKPNDLGQAGLSNIMVVLTSIWLTLITRVPDCFLVSPTLASRWAFRVILIFLDLILKACLSTTSMRLVVQWISTF